MRVRGVNGGLIRLEGKKERKIRSERERDVEQKGGEFGRAWGEKGILKRREGLEGEQMEEGMSL